jgi:cysteinyl-tRNA synthetase
MDDDFNTAQAIGHMYELARQLNRLMDSVRPKELKGLAEEFERAASLFKQYGQILGILALPPQEFLEQEQARLLEKKGLSAEEIGRLIAERNQARKEKDWAKADVIRDRLIELKVLLKDTPQGTVWQIEE